MQRRGCSGVEPSEAYRFERERAGGGGPCLDPALETTWNEMRS